MAFRIKNDPAAVANTAPTIDQAKLDQVDLDIIANAFSYYAVVSGGTVDEAAVPNMSVDVAAGSVWVAGVQVTLTNPGNFAIGAAHATNARFDLVVASNVGTISVIAGTNSTVNTSSGNTNAVIPSYPATSVVLAVVYVRPGTTSIVNNDIDDRRIFLGGSLALDHGTLSGLTDDDHVGYFRLAGRAGGQTANGGTSAGENLTLESTAHATKGNIRLGATIADFTKVTVNGTDTSFVASGSTLLSALTVQRQGALAGDFFVSQFHSHSSTATAASSLAFVRSRGTSATPVAVLSTTTLAQITAFGYDGTDFEAAGTIAISVDGTPANNDMPGKLSFLTTPSGSTTPTEKLRIAADGAVSIFNEGTLRFYDSGSSNFIGLRANTSRTTDITYVLPATDPTADQILKAGAPAGNVSTLSWSSTGGGHAIHDEVAAALTQRADLHIIGKGITAIDNASRTELIVPTVYDAIVDSDDTNAAGKGNVYSTLQAAITAGHVAILFRTSTDSADIEITTENVTLISGVSTASSSLPVNLKVSKAGVQVQNLKFDGKYLWLNALSCISFANLFTGNLTSPSALINNANGYTEADVALVFDGGTSGGIASLGYGVLGGREVFGWSALAAGNSTAGTMTIPATTARGINESLAETWPDNTAITSLMNGHLRISVSECKVIANQWVGCSNEFAIGLLIDGAADGIQINIPTFFGNTLWNLIALMTEDDSTNPIRNFALTGGGGGSNTTTSMAIESYPPLTSGGNQGEIRYGSINGTSWRGIDAGWFRNHGAGWNIAGNTIAGTNSQGNNITFTLQRDGGSYTAATSPTTGTATSTTSSTLVVAGTPWTVNAFSNMLVRTNDGKIARIVSNTNNTLTVQWWQGGTPSGTATFRIYIDDKLGYTSSGTGTIAKKGIILSGSELIAYSRNSSSTDSGTSTAVSAPAVGTAPTMTDSGKTWTTDQWKGQLLETNGKSAIIVSNTATVLTVDYWLGGAPTSGNTYNIRATLQGCVRGWAGTTTATIADAATAENRSDTVYRGSHGNAVVTTFGSILAGNTITDVRQATQPNVGTCNWCSGCTHAQTNNSPLLIQSNIGVNAANWVFGPRYIMGVNAILGTTTFDINNSANVAILPNATSANITITNAPSSMAILGFTMGQTGLLSNNMLPDGRNLTFARTAGDRAPGCNVYVNRTGGVATVGFLARMDTANDNSWVLPGTGAAVSCLGVVQSAAADAADTLIATVDGTVVDIECDTVAVARRDFIGNSLITNGRGTSLGGAPVAGQTIAQAQTAKAGGANGTVRCIITRQ